ncbi:MAG TPA: biopolymer transporter ExbD [Verrucomicrobiae bacterium]|jgi:biopolymer transport protein ExbD|nr:biopolymer transporter ExbD [Verrucomicrobiae bacterium]
MQFTSRKRRGPPTVIIISLIDVLIVVLIFLMVTTTFKQQPSVKLTLPESKEAKAGSSENLRIVTISKQGVLYLDKDPMTLAKLQEKLVEAAKANPSTTVAVSADADAPWGLVVKVRDAAQSANIKQVNANVKTGP